MRPSTYLCLFVPILSRPMCAGSVLFPWLWPLAHKQSFRMAGRYVEALNEAGQSIGYDA